MRDIKQSITFCLESDKDYYIAEVLEGNTILLPSTIKALKGNWKREVYSMIRSDNVWTFLSQEFEIPLIMDYLNIDLV